jgi:hypothetical protein
MLKDACRRRYDVLIPIQAGVHAITVEFDIMRPLVALGHSLRELRKLWRNPVGQSGDRPSMAQCAAPMNGMAGASRCR